MKMKTVVTKLICFCISLILVSLCFTDKSSGKIDPKSIMGVWLLDEGQGNIATDSSGNKNDGKIVGAKWTDGKFGKALEFDGSSHVEIPASKTTDDIMSGFTYLIWVKPTAAPPNANTRIIERDWHNPTIQIGSTDFYGSIAVNGDQANTNVRGGTWKMGNWTFVAITYDGAVLKLYVNGEMVNSKNVGKPDANPNATTPPNQGAIWLATWKAPGWDFIGVLDEAGVFNTPLSDTDIKEIMNNGLEKLAPVYSVGKMAIAWGSVKNMN
jgi:hypothetical protein